MIEHFILALGGTFALGLATWHIVRVVSQGSLFKPFWVWLRWKVTTRPSGQLRGFYWWWLEGWDCRLCFGTEVALVLTWAALATGLVVKHSLIPPAEWAFAFIVGPFLTAAWAEVVRRIECLEAPE